MAVDSRVLVAHSESAAIESTLRSLLGEHPLHWSVTIRPSTVARHWSIEIFRPGLFLACSARPSQQSAAEIRELVKAVLCGLAVTSG